MSGRGRGRGGSIGPQARDDEGNLIAEALQGPPPLYPVRLQVEICGWSCAAVVVSSGCAWLCDNATYLVLSQEIKPSTFPGKPENTERLEELRVRRCWWSFG